MRLDEPGQEKNIATMNVIGRGFHW